MTGTITSRADVATGTPDGYAKQRVVHPGRTCGCTTDGPVSSAAIGGATRGTTPATPT